MKRGNIIAAVIAAGVLSAGSVGTASAAPLIHPTRQPGIPSTLASAIALDKVHHTVTLPLHEGYVKGRGSVWFILTDTSSLREAERLGINWSPKLANGLGTAAVQAATLSPGHGGDRMGGGAVVKFAGGVDFAGKRVVVPGPNVFPLDPASHAGPVADPAYSPQFTFGNGVVYNGAEVANSTGQSGKVLALDSRHRTVTLRLTAGFYLGRDVLYLSTESSQTQQAALEDATFAPNLAAAPRVGSDDPQVSAREAIIPIVNGPLGTANPQRQGLQSAVLGQGDPLNMIREEPECSDPNDPANCSALEYSPNWDVHPLAWTPAAIAAGQQVRVTSHEVAHELFEKGELVNAAPDGPVNQDPEIRGFRAAGVVVNCPPIFVAPGA